MFQIDESKLRRFFFAWGGVFSNLMQHWGGAGGFVGSNVASNATAPLMMVAVRVGNVNVVVAPLSTFALEYYMEDAMLAIDYRSAVHADAVLHWGNENSITFVSGADEVLQCSRGGWGHRTRRRNKRQSIALEQLHTQNLPACWAAAHIRRTDHDRYSPRLDDATVQLVVSVEAMRNKFTPKVLEQFRALQTRLGDEISALLDAISNYPNWFFRRREIQPNNRPVAAHATATNYNFALSFILESVELAALAPVSNHGAPSTFSASSGGFHLQFSSKNGDVQRHGSGLRQWLMHVYFQGLACIISAHAEDGRAQMVPLPSPTTLLEVHTNLLARNMPILDTTTITLRMAKTGITVRPGAIAAASCMWRQYAHAIQDYRKERASERTREGQEPGVDNFARMDNAMQQFLNNVTQPLGEHLQDVKQHLLRGESVSRIAVRVSLEHATLCLPFFDTSSGDDPPATCALLCTLKRVALFSRSDNIVRWYFDPDGLQHAPISDGNPLPVRLEDQAGPGTRSTGRYGATTVRGCFELLAFVVSLVSGGSTRSLPEDEECRDSSTCRMALPRITASFHAIDTVEARRGLAGRVALVCSISAPSIRIDAYSDVFQPGNYYHFSSHSPAPASRMSRSARGTKYEWDITMRLQPGRVLFTSRDVEGRFVTPVTLFELPLPGVIASGILKNKRNVFKIGVAFPNEKISVPARNVFRFCHTSGFLTSWNR